MVDEFFLPFRALPPLALLMLPLAYLPYGQAFTVFLVFNVGLMMLGIKLLANEAKSTHQKIALLLGALAYEATFIALAQGQPTIIMMFITVMIYKFLKEKKFLYAGLVSGLYLLKTQYIVIVPFVWIITKFNKKYLLGLLASVTGFFLVSLVLVGPNVLAQYPSFVTYTETTKYFSPPFKLVSVQGYLASLAQLETIPRWVILASIVMYLLVGFVLHIRTKSNPLEYLFGMAILFGLLFSLHVFGQDLVLIIVTIALLAKTIPKSMRTTISLAFMLLAPYSNVAPISFMMYVIPGLILLVFPETHE